LKGLLIAEPWIDRILSGRKTWEMRRRACHYRGPIALIRSRSGKVVGVAEVANSLPSLDTREDYAAAEPYHAIRLDEQAAAFEAGWRTPWVLVNVRSLTSPVPYKHSSGAVIWVNLDDAVTAAINVQICRSDPLEKPGYTGGAIIAPEPPQEEHKTCIAGARESEAELEGIQPTRSGSRDTRVVQLTGGNIRNSHIYLPLDFFPDDAIGGANRHHAAPRSVTVTFRPGEIVETDIDRAKRILRTRTAVRDFLARAGMREGDNVLIERIAPYSYVFSKARK
jgi:hypothetical protein